MEENFWKELCRRLNLGEIESAPVSLQGGFLHKMYAISTEKGKYAVKLLNPSIMKRDSAMENYRQAERLEEMLEQWNISILPALIFEGKKMQELKGQFFYVYEWYDGKALKTEEIRESHSWKIGRMLADIHNVRRQDLPYIRPELHVDWDYYSGQLRECNRELYEQMKEISVILYENMKKGNQAIRQIPSGLAICHNDMDTKNVLWKKEDCRIIDLECLSCSSPYAELYETALCWSGFENCHIDVRLLGTFVKSYERAGGNLPPDWEILYDSNLGRLEWLEYNIKRALGIEADLEAQKLGERAAKEAITHIAYYHEAKDEILNCLAHIN